MFSTLFTKIVSGTDRVMQETKRESVAIAKPVPKKVQEEYSAQHLLEYAEVAKSVGVDVRGSIAIEAFKAFLRDKDLPVYSLDEVIKYMDAKAAKESEDKCGWGWIALREKDRYILGASGGFGVPAQTGDRGKIIKPASDYFRPRESHYLRTVPLHALKRVALIEKEFVREVNFLVSDYVLKKDILYPDPFLMAVIPNLGLAQGIGRFVIDFWDEPGFGIEQMLK